VDPDDTSPILIVPYMWIGDFVRGHTVVRVLKQRWPNRPVDLLTTSLCAPLVEYMPGVRAGVVCDLPRSRLALARSMAPAGAVSSARLPDGAGAAPNLESALGAGPGRDSRTDRVHRRGPLRAAQPVAPGRERPAPASSTDAALALPDGAPLPPAWPVPQLRVTGAETDQWRQANGLGGGKAIALAPGSGRRLQALDLLFRRPRGFSPKRASTYGWSAAPAKRPWRPNRCRRRAARPRSDRDQLAQRHDGDGGGPACHFQRLRP